LFLLQAVLLALLIGGLAQPHRRDATPAHAPTRHLLILDGSASMQAREGRQTRFEAARDELRRRIEALPSDDEAMLIVAANEARVIAPFSHDHKGLIARLRDVRPVDTAANLDLALAIAHGAAMRSDRPTRTTLFSDTPPSELDPAWRSTADIFQVGETDDNVAIQSLEIAQGRYQNARDTHAQVVVRNFSYREAHGFLTLTLDERVISRRGFSLGARDARSFLVRDLHQAGVLRADLEVADALAADNHASGWVRPARPLRVLVVSAPSRLRDELAAVADATPNLDLQLVAPADYHRGLRSDPDVVVFHRLTPDGEPKLPTLYLYPPPDSRLFTVRSSATDVDVLDWSDRHAALRGVHLPPPFPLRRVRVLDVPAWAEPLLSSQTDVGEIPLVLAGVHHGHRIACITFDLAREHLVGPDSMPFVMLLLNLLDWLAPADESVAVLTTGSIYTMDDLPMLPRRVIDPRGQTLSFPGERALTLAPLHAGEYRIEVDGTRRRVLANFFDSFESDIARPAKEPHPLVPPTTRAQRPAADASLGWWLLAAAVGLFLAEWFVAART
ncbi:MAG: hypothetical protein A3J75_01365, partial [Acidobacteria bacterium RBG_16_68_9]